MCQYRPLLRAAAAAHFLFRHALNLNLLSSSTHWGFNHPFTDMCLRQLEMLAMKLKSTVTNIYIKPPDSKKRFFSTKFAFFLFHTVWLENEWKPPFEKEEARLLEIFSHIRDTHSTITLTSSWWKNQTSGALLVFLKHGVSDHKKVFAGWGFVGVCVMFLLYRNQWFTHTYVCASTVDL